MIILKKNYTFGGVILNNTQNTKNELKKGDPINEINAKRNSELKTKQEIIDLVKELQEKTKKDGIRHELRVRNIEKENKFIISADYSEPVQITEEEYNRIKENKDVEEIIGFNGTFKQTSENFGESKYGIIVVESQESNINIEYEIVKTDTGYSFIYPAGPGNPMTTAGSIIQFYLDDDDIIYVENVGKKSLKEYAEILAEKLSKEEQPIVTVNYEDDKLYLYESSK